MLREAPPRLQGRVVRGAGGSFRHLPGIDLNDRALREIFIELGGVTHGIPRKGGFNITPAPEIMAVLCLARDCRHLRDRLARIVIGYTCAREPVTADTLLAEGATGLS
jgi:formate--tetrahydrofolate ligase